MKTQKQLNPNMSYRDFKKLRMHDVNFQDAWHKRIRKIKRVFEKTFVLRDMPLDPQKLLDEYTNENDFIDHVFHHSIISSTRNESCILIYDQDFYSYPGDFYLLIFNNAIIELAQKNNKLL